MASSIGDNATATPEVGEPDRAGVSGAASLWWTWTAVNSGTTTIDTFGSGFDTTLGVYTGVAVDAPALEADNNDANSTPQSRVSFTAAGGGGGCSVGSASASTPEAMWIPGFAAFVLLALGRGARPPTPSRWRA